MRAVTAAAAQRSGVWNGVYFATMYELRKRRTFGDSVFIPGLIGGCLGTVCNQPWDTVVRRGSSAARVLCVTPVPRLCVFVMPHPLTPTTSHGRT